MLLEDSLICSEINFKICMGPWSIYKKCLWVLLTHVYWFRATGGYICGCGRPSNLVIVIFQEFDDTDHFRNSSYYYYISGVWWVASVVLVIIIVIFQDQEFDGTGGFLGSTMKRVQAMARAGHNRYIWYLLLFCIFVFFICWLLMKFRW